MKLNRRQFLHRSTDSLLSAGLALPLLTGCSGAKHHSAKVVVVGGGYGGAACARYLRYFDPQLDITLVEPQQYYYSCPFSNAVIADIDPVSIIKHDYQTLADKFAIKIIRDTVSGITPAKQQVQLSDGATLPYDRLVLSPGISFRWNHIFAGYDPAAITRMPHAWKAGEQTRLLRQQLQAMPDGGVFVMVVPGPPFRCPPGPYERASLIAWYLQRHKPRSKILILDANEHFSKQDLFEEAWQRLYPTLIERIPISEGGLVTQLDPTTMQIRAEAGLFKADVANVIPFQQAGKLAVDNDLVEQSGWCAVNHQTFESERANNIHIIGDSCLAGAMPKSASSANSQAKVCSLAIVNLLHDKPPGEMYYHNTCYSLITPEYGISINAMFRYEQQQFKLIQQAGGLSPLRAAASVRRAEAKHARAWYHSINLDTFGNGAG
ncbi:MAG: FCSD flavin-binding domain-containing protein [Gammaproteobacteria bacterium]